MNNSFIKMIFNFGKRYENIFPPPLSMLSVGLLLVLVLCLPPGGAQRDGLPLLHSSCLSPPDLTSIMSAHTALIIPSPSTISFTAPQTSRTCLDSQDLLVTLHTIDELRRRSAFSKDDSRIDYTSVLNIEDKERRFSEDLVDCDIKSNIQMKKLYRQIQRQVHCDDSTEVGFRLVKGSRDYNEYFQPTARLAWVKQEKNKCITNKDFNLQKYSNQEKLELKKESNLPPRKRSRSVASRR